ncbi:Hypothetical protein GbCGDNIH1_0165 [Granulibacter bethesdensis CGDNIH1]|uniref:Uncharacterized protein n=2 Tax=Granulibacter bethesdensis TaxID=364410 RepID=Q0BVT9_GRABC|nr:Hypothetical protein GbCGDNIH1_0165 [Granulibacter bethesdensis CGDNIH1]APH50837.1 Hypothetical protein GbCGDNIH5_0165 [Granulibacter bethesdensis]APH63531.1 Hypothetical protein GbCGDNIH1I4_0165 [Granulibacter bethesdensis]
MRKANIMHNTHGPCRQRISGRAIPVILALGLPLLMAACAGQVPETGTTHARLMNNQDQTAWLGSGKIASESYDFNKSVAAHNVLCSWEPTFNPDNCR